MMLKRLVEFADRIPDLPPPMYTPLALKWQIELAKDGTCLGITPLGDDSTNNRGLRVFAPNLKRSGTKAPPLLLADNAKYVLGMDARAGRNDCSPRDSRHFQAFRDLVSRCADQTGEPGVRAVLRFLDAHRAHPIAIPKDLEAGDNICFRVGETRPSDLDSVKRFWLRINLPKDDRHSQCLVCGRVGPVDRVSPIAIKGLARIGGQSSGMAVVSANKDAFWSYGAEQSLIAPTCRTCGEAYANSLNHLIATDPYNVFVGPTAFLFWSSTQAGFSPATLLSQPTEEDVKSLILSYRSGRHNGLVDAPAFYALSLSASASRVAIRDWLDTTIPAVQANLARWFGLQSIADIDGSPGRPVGVLALASSLYFRPDQMAANVPRALVRCALRGGPLPNWLLAQAIRRNRAEQGMTRNRAALIKAILLSQLDHHEEDYMQKLETQCKAPGYLCGRLLAELEAAQYQAVRPKATLVDRYYGAASASPAIVFGPLMRGLQEHMGKLRRDRPGAYYAIDSRIQDILADLGEFPKTLSLKEQALFALGYYHQKAANRAAASDNLANKSNKEH
jgi:CRISPR-associated protein Csd1